MGEGNKFCEERGELIFLRYAFPATECCKHVEVSSEEKKDFEIMLKYGGIPSRKRLEEIFPNAVRHLKSWDSKNVRDYWCREHNKIVSDNKLCMVYGFEVSNVSPPENGEICIARVKGIESLRAKSYLELGAGDLISIHASQVAEKLSQEDYIKYFI
ncbi:MAG: hypothetical protein PHH54_03700 [Candidatus Nanoarchaeia archaeon]|nr:hypothetical protein [Candidatus Nanoarchaeia archaeon]MDD5741063.1 hypothetical protein [Candidatus Nanoarchaeia archaeon]